MGKLRNNKLEKRQSDSGPMPSVQWPVPKQMVRLQKVIADAGVTSRRKAETLITAGRVTVNGCIIRELGTRVDQRRDHIKVDGRHLKPVPPETFVMLHKPAGVLSSMSDPQGRQTIAELLQGVGPRVFPVGRLDFDSEGLMLLTNHGELAQALLHPRFHVPKTYRIKLKGILSDEDMTTLERGVVLEDGPTGKAIVQKVRKVEKNSWIDLTIFEGRKHQVKRMLESTGHPVLRLIRIRFGPLLLGDLPVGHFRFLADREANALRGILRERSKVDVRSSRGSIPNSSRKRREPRTSNLEHSPHLRARRRA